jgi:hypothetical protein
LFEKGESDNILIIKATTDRYLRQKRGCTHRCFVDFEKASNSVDRDARGTKGKKRESARKWLNV